MMKPAEGGKAGNHAGDADGIQKMAVAYRTATAFQKWAMFCPQIRTTGSAVSGREAAKRACWGPYFRGKKRFR